MTLHLDDNILEDEGRLLVFMTLKQFVILMLKKRFPQSYHIVLPYLLILCLIKVRQY